MPVRRNGDPSATLFCRALIAAVFDPQDAVEAFAARLLSRHLAKLI